MNWNNNIDEAPFNKTIMGLFEYKSGGREVRIIQRTAKFTVEASSDMDCEDCEYNESDDKYYCKEGWYEQANDFDDCGWWWISTEYLKSWEIIEYPKRERGEFPKPTRKPGEKPCGECHLQPGETCDVCGAKERERGE